MATNYFKAIHHNHHKNHQSLRRRHSIDCPRSSSSFFLKPNTQTPSYASSSSSSSSTTNSSTGTTKFSLFRSIFTAFSVSCTASASSVTTPSTSNTTSFDPLKEHLAAKNFREADEETRRLLILLAGEAAQKRGYVFFSEVQFISVSDLKTIDELWTKYSDEKFGYSVQKKIWNKVSKDFTKFFLKVGWMKKLDTEVEQYNYRSFPNEFIWEMTDETPEGHLPLTNALRGTQLLNSILSHPAFQADDDKEEEEEESEENGGLRNSIGGSTDKPLNKSRLFKPDYSF